jgi:hypothetical protein
MEDFAIKLVASPLLIGAASLVGRRWGQSVAGWLVGLPLTSGPVAFFLALDYGAGFAVHAAAGSLAGTAVQAGFCVAYVRTAQACDWPLALMAATVAFVLGGVLYEITAPRPAVLLPVAVTALALALRLLPRAAASARIGVAPPKWDIPARMVVAAGLVVGLSSAAPLIGPRLAGLIATYPVFATVLAVFAHRLEGEPAARSVLQGLLIGLFGFAGFFAVLAGALPAFGIAGAFACAALTALAIQGCSLWLIRRGGLSPRAP